MNLINTKGDFKKEININPETPTKYLQKKFLAGALSTLMLLNSQCIFPTNAEAKGVTKISDFHQIINPKQKNPNWYSKTGGTWKFASDNGKNKNILHYTEIQYIAYDQLAVLSASKLSQSDLNIIIKLSTDQGTAAVGKWIAKKIGKEAAAKYMPYIGYSAIYYDVLTALLNRADHEKMENALKNKTGIAICKGYTRELRFTGLGTTIVTKPFTCIEYWCAPNIYNPEGQLGTFKKN